jgi:hypothetical protein
MAYGPPMIADVPPAYHLVLQQLPASAEHAHAHAPRVGTHGMVLFGSGDETYVSHIPMFRAPHDMQLVLAVSLSHPEWKASPDFSRESHTLEPERMDLNELMDGRRKSFQATVYRGNFESGGGVMWKGVTVRVKDVRWMHGLSSKEKAAERLQYMLVGSRSAAYLVHAISGPPDFDQVLKVSMKEGAPGDAELAKGVLVSIPARANAGEARLKPGESALEVEAGGKRMKLVIERELSYLVGPEFTVPPAK